MAITTNEEAITILPRCRERTRNAIARQPPELREVARRDWVYVFFDLDSEFGRFLARGLHPIADDDEGLALVGIEASRLLAVFDPDGEIPMLTERMGAFVDQPLPPRCARLVIAAIPVMLTDTFEVSPPKAHESE